MKDHTPATDPVKPVHRAKLFSDTGTVSPLCAKSPKAINLRKATWTIVDDAVTCVRCLNRMKEAKA
jgi:hypothetical protein